MPPPPLPDHMFEQQGYDPTPHQHGQFTGAPGRGPEVPAASGLPAPKLTAHTLGLLNSFKIDDQGPAPTQSQSSVPQPSQYSTPGLQHPHPQRPPHELVSPPQMVSPPTHSGPPLDQPQPKARTVHQDSLLTLFNATPSAKLSASMEPAELSAHPLTPGFAQVQPANYAAKTPNQNLLDLFTAQKKPGLTSATVSGPVNAPDFDTVKRRKQPSINGNSRGPSPATQPPFTRTDSDNTVVAASKHAQQMHGDVGSASAPTFQPQILKRPEQGVPTSGSAAHAQNLLDMFKSPSPQPATAQPATGSMSTSQTQSLLDMFKGGPAQPAIARPDQADNLLAMFKGGSSHPKLEQTIPAAPAVSSQPPSAQSQGLLNLFKSPSPQPPVQPVEEVQPAVTASPSTLAAKPASFDRRESVHSDQRNALLGLFGKPSPQPAHRMPIQQAQSTLPFNRTPNPPTPQTVMSGIVSPVSPLQQGSRTGTPAELASRSRISSMGEPVSGQPEPLGGQGQNAAVGSQFGEAASSGPKSPVDKTFLLGFLEDVARRGR